MSQTTPTSSIQEIKTPIDLSSEEGLNETMFIEKLRKDLESKDNTITSLKDKTKIFVSKLKDDCTKQLKAQEDKYLIQIQDFKSQIESSRNILIELDKLKLDLSKETGKYHEQEEKNNMLNKVLGKEQAQYQSLLSLHDNEIKTFQSTLDNSLKELEKMKSNFEEEKNIINIQLKESQILKDKLIIENKQLNSNIFIEKENNESEILALNNKIDEYNIKINDLTNKLEDIKIDQSVKPVLKSNSNEIENLLNEKISYLSSEINMKNQSINELNLDLDESETQLKESLTIIQSKEQTFIIKEKSLSKEIERGNKNYELNLLALKEDLSKEVKLHQTLKASHVNELKSLQDSHDDSTMKIDSLTMELQNSIADLSNKDEIIINLKNKHKEIESNQDIFNLSSNEIKLLNSDNNELKIDIANKSNIIIDLENKIKLNSEELEELKLINDEQNNEIVKFDSLSESFNNQIRVLSDEKNKLIDDLRSVNLQINVVNTENVDFKSKLSSLESSSAMSLTELNLSKQENESKYNNEILSLKDSISSFRNQITNLNNEIVTLKKDNKNLLDIKENELQDISQSQSLSLTNISNLEEEIVQLKNDLKIEKSEGEKRKEMIKKKWTELTEKSKLNENLYNESVTTNKQLEIKFQKNINKCVDMEKQITLLTSQINSIQENCQIDLIKITKENFEKENKLLTVIEEKNKIIQLNENEMDVKDHQLKSEVNDMAGKIGEAHKELGGNYKYISFDFCY
jgi:chromosome segregation ATPase